jgi:DNA-directed RNA polymerase specialized sigma24 family protein
MIRTVYNIYIDNLRKKKLYIRHSETILLRQGESSANNVEADMNYNDVYKIIQSIRTEWREIFLMYCKGFEYNEISQKQG